MVETPKKFAQRVMLEYNANDTPIRDVIAKNIFLRDAAIRAECADRAVKCFFTTMAESGLSTGNDYAVLVISDKIRAAIMEGKP